MALLRGWFFQQRIQIQRSRKHRQTSVPIVRPLLLGSIPIKFHAVPIGVAQIQRFAYAMIGLALQLDAGLDQAAKCVGQFGSRGIENRQVVQTRRTVRRWSAAGAFPCIKANVMVISACGKKCSLISKALSHVKPKDVAIKRQRSIQIRDLEMNVADANLGMNGVTVIFRICSHLVCPHYTPARLSLFVHRLRFDNSDA